MAPLNSGTAAAPLVWDVYPAEDFNVSDDGETITAVTGMIADDRSVMGPKLSGGKHVWDFTVNKTRYPDAHIFLGVCDVSGESPGRTWGYSPPVGSLYKGKEPNEHGSEDKFKVHEKEFAYEENGFVGHVCRVTVDLDEKTLSFQIDDTDPVTIKDEMPAAVRPWAFIYHEEDSITMKKVM